MGIDFLDLTWRIEREFKIRITMSEAQTLFDTGRNADPHGRWLDLQVRDLVLLIQRKLGDDNVSARRWIFETLRPHISECLVVAEAEITLESWLRRDLGMD